MVQVQISPVSKVGLGQSTTELALYREAIENGFPGLVVDSIDLAGEGMDNLALVFNDEYVFRFPKLEDAAAKIELEAVLLPVLQSSLDIRIPSPEFVGTDPGTGLTFSGYRRIEGVPLEPEVLLDLDPEKQTRLTEQIARFLRNLHSFPIDQAARLGLKTNDFRADYSGDLGPIRELLFPRLHQGEREYVERLYQDYLSDPGNFDYEPTVIHADLSPEHIIYDPATRTIAGVIDFSDMVIGDPDYEMHWLYADYGDRFLQTYLAFNLHPSPDRLLRKLQFFNRANTVADVLIGFHRGDPELVEDSIAALKRQVEAEDWS